jgi:hypothetical protein
MFYGRVAQGSLIASTLANGEAPCAQLAGDMRREAETTHRKRTNRRNTLPDTGRKVQLRPCTHLVYQTLVCNSPPARADSSTDR